MNILQILFLFSSAIVHGQYAGWSSFYSFDQITGVVGQRMGWFMVWQKIACFPMTPLPMKWFRLQRSMACWEMKCDAHQVTDNL